LRRSLLLLLLAAAARRGSYLWWLVTREDPLGWWSPRSRYSSSVGGGVFVGGLFVSGRVGGRESGREFAAGGEERATCKCAREVWQSRNSPQPSKLDGEDSRSLRVDGPRPGKEGGRGEETETSRSFGS